MQTWHSFMWKCLCTHRYIHYIIRRVNVSGLLENSIFSQGLSSTEMVNGYWIEGPLLHRIFHILEYCVLFGNYISCFNLVKCVSLHRSFHLNFVCAFFSLHMFLYLLSRFNLRAIINFHSLSFFPKYIQCAVCRHAR